MSNMRIKKTPLIRLVVDLVIFIATAVPLLLVHIYVKPFKFGFYCNDPSISYPYSGDSVPMPICAVIGVVLSAGSFIVIEFTLSLGCRKTRDTRLFNVLWTIGKLILIFSFGMCVNLALTETAKLGIGRLRPNFLDVCKPNMTLINCSQGYIKDFVCTNTELSQKIILDSRKSFPSGHASFATFVAFFVGYYYQKRLKMDFSVLLRPFLQMGLSIMAIYVSVSRITDFRHHWDDVLAGAILGVLVAMWTLGCLGRHLDLELGPFLSKRPTTPTLDTPLPLSNPCTPEPPTFTINSQPGFSKRDPV